MNQEAPESNPTTPMNVAVRYENPAKRPVFTYIILVLTILTYIAQQLSTRIVGFDVPATFGAKVNELIIQGEIWRLVTPMVLHASLLHIGFNMYALVVFGHRLERVYGHTRFLLLYFLAGITGNLFSFYLTPGVSIGASTAVFGLLAAEGIFIYTNRRFFPNATYALREIILILVFNIFIGFSTPQIDNWGHMGGLIGGLAFAWFAGPLIQIKKEETAIRLYDTHRDNRIFWISGIHLFVVALLSAMRILR
jgi:rhomboid protease GluP